MASLHVGRRMPPDALVRLARRIVAASRLTVLTGAGVSAASGVPTFRGTDGLWRRHRPEDLATPEAFARDPRTVWEWYDWRRQVIAGCQPNAAHQVLARWGERAGVTLITQNVDGLHERAGAHNVVRFHGTLWELRCGSGCARSPRCWRDERVPLPELPPRCPACGGLARPAVVWFGEPIDPSAVERSFHATTCDVFLLVGTSSVVYPAAQLVYDAARHGAFTAEISLETTPASDRVDLVIEDRAEVVLAKLDELVTLLRRNPMGGPGRDSMP